MDTIEDIKKQLETLQEQVKKQEKMASPWRTLQASSMRYKPA